MHVHQSDYYSELRGEWTEHTQTLTHFLMVILQQTPGDSDVIFLKKSQQFLFYYQYHVENRNTSLF